MRSLKPWRAIVVGWWIILFSALFFVTTREAPQANPRPTATQPQVPKPPAIAQVGHNPHAMPHVSHGSSAHAPVQFASAQGPIEPDRRRHVRVARLPPTEDAGEDDLLIGNPYHKGGVSRPRSRPTPQQQPAPAQVNPPSTPSGPQLGGPNATPAAQPAVQAPRQRRPQSQPQAQTRPQTQSATPRQAAPRMQLAPQVNTRPGGNSLQPGATTPAPAATPAPRNQPPAGFTAPQQQGRPTSPLAVPSNSRPNSRPNSVQRGAAPNKAGATTQPIRIERQPVQAAPLAAPNNQAAPNRPQGGGDELLQGNPYHRGGAAPVRRPQVNAPRAPQRVPAEPQTNAQIEQIPTPHATQPQTPVPPAPNAPAARPTAPHSTAPERSAVPAERPATPPADSQTSPRFPAADESDDEEDGGLFGGLYGDDDDSGDGDDSQDDDGESSDDEDDDEEGDTAVDPHLELYSKNMYPSAKECAKCHEQVYKEWAVSSHAYANISPMFNKFEQKLNDLASGTIGYFCLRCHAPVAMAMNTERDDSPLDHIPAGYEGVTCIVCHRVNERYTRVNGERLIQPGPITNPVYGTSHGEGLAEVLSKPQHYKVKTGPDKSRPGQEIHTEALFFDQLNQSEFCVSCHQVAVFPGIKLEVVWEQYRASPACKEGISCQDCHMGKVPGKPLGYATGPGAVVGGKPVNPNRKHANHMFFGPGYSVAHPGIFPFNLKTDEYDWKPTDWIQFDYRAGWGSEKFEEAVDDGKIHVNFPEIWSDADDRRDAWDIVQENMETMAQEKMVRRQLMENSSHIDGPFFDSRPRCGKALKFHYDVSNLNSGHNAPSGSLGAQPQIWVNAVLINPRGERVWESGYTDALGDVADTLSLEVAAGRCPPDNQLVNFQSKFLFTHAKGTDREWYLPVNIDIDQLPFIRPSGFPITTLNHPPFIRMEQRSLPPLSTRKARYKVPARAMKVPGKYRLSVRMRSRSHPVYFVRFCDGTPDMERRINEGMLDFHQDSVEFIVR